MVDGQLGCFQYLVIIDYTAINFLFLFPGSGVHKHIGYILRNGTVGLWGMQYSHLL